jgi:hypothetical protein
MKPGYAVNVGVAGSRRHGWGTREVTPGQRPSCFEPPAAGMAGAAVEAGDAASWPSHPMVSLRLRWWHKLCAGAAQASAKSSAHALRGGRTDRRLAGR